ncbi:MAG: aminotransferase class IV, partial [Spirochaetaceae bacterium]|nr:aminotransferase class IV [Spirochaetaceae bacterium]
EIIARRSEEGAAMGKTIYFNGGFHDEDEKLLSVKDRALCFGDGLFEVVLCLGGKFLLFSKHMGRMATAAAELQMRVPRGASELLDAARVLAERNGIADGELYIELTRGEAPRYHLFPQGIEPNLFMVLNPLRPIKPETRELGVRVCLYPDLRHGICRWKTLNLLVNVLAKEEAKRTGTYEACFWREGPEGKYISEGASSSFFYFQGGVLYTPELDNILPGATRASVIGIARERGIKVVEKRILLDEILASDEAFLVSTVSRVTPLIGLGDAMIGDGKPGSGTRSLQAAYAEFIASSLE